MAAALITDRLTRAGLQAKIRSAGIDAPYKQPPPSEALALMRERGIDLSQHRSHRLSRDLVREFPIILTMETNQTACLEDRWPFLCGRVYRLGHFGGFDVPDPYGRGRRAYEETLQLIEQGIDDWMARLVGSAHARESGRGGRLAAHDE